MPTWNKSKFLKLVDEKDAARSLFNTVSAERQLLIGEHNKARQVLDRAANPKYGETPPTKTEIDAANALLEKFEHLDRQYSELGSKSLRKGKLVEDMAEFLKAKGIRDALVLEQWQGKATNVR